MAVVAFGTNLLVSGLFWLAIMVAVRSCDPHAEDCAGQIALIAPIMVWVGIEVFVYLPVQLVAMAIAAASKEAG